MALAVRAAARILSLAGPTAVEAATTLSARTDAGGVVWLELSHPAGAPRLDTRVLTSLLQALEQIAEAGERGEIRGVVLTSAAEKVFLAGADLGEMRRLATGQEAAAAVELGQRVTDRLEALPVPTAAWIRGACIGSGVGLAAACDLRLVEDVPAVRISLPEVQYGIIPALGCCARLPGLVGFEAALGLAVYNRSWSAAEAARRGFAQVLLPAGSTAERVARLLEEGRSRGRRVRLPGRGALLRRRARRVARGAGSRNPAVPAAAQALLAGATRSRRTALARERELLPPLLLRPETGNRIHLAGAVRSRSRIERPSGTRELALVGGGEMAADLLTRAAQARVRALHHAPLRSTRQAVVSRVADRLRQAVESGRLREEEADAAWQRLAEARGFGGFGLADAALVLADTPAAGRLRSHLRPDALLLIEIAAAQQPTPASAPAAWFRLLPEVSPTRVVELLGDGPAADGAHALLRELGFVTIPVGAPAGLWEPLARRCAVEAARALDAGVGAGELEGAALEFGMAIGPLRLADEIGLENATPAGEETPRSIARLLELQRGGRHAEAGFYLYPRGSTPELDEEIGATPLAREAWRRICQRMREEAERLLELGTAVGRGDVDLVSVLALGFPLERGGLLHDGQAALDSRSSAR